MEQDARDIFDMLAPVAQLSEGMVWSTICVFARVGAAAALLPGLGERNTPVRLKLAIAAMLSFVIWPAVAPLAELAGATMIQIIGTIIAEAIAGLLFGISVRLLVIALQMAGSMAAQSVSLSQMFGEGLTADPQPAYSHLLAITGITLFFALGLHFYLATALIETYEVIPFGQLPLSAAVADWGTHRVAAAFNSAAAIAAPFVVASFAYNAAIGAINKAMPQLMVAFVGAPAITAAALLLIMLVTPLAMHVWGRDIEAVMLDPFGFRG